MSKEKAFIYNTRLGRVLIGEENQAITRLYLITKKEEGTNRNALLEEYRLEETPLIKEAMKQFEQYLAGERKEFDIAIKPQGTAFQQKVWEALRAIPYGETRSYKEIAMTIGNEKACRAVGMANNHNPILCIIPCHRVIGSNHKLVGFGCGLDVKEQLLHLENENFMFKK